MKTRRASLPLSAGDVLLPLRLVTGWTYFSAFWRRLVLENKLDPSAAGYVGEKFNHFLPNAFGIKPVIAFFVSHPDWLWWKLLGFTLTEGLVGLALLAGLYTRIAGAATSLLAGGILLGAGWLGTTCLDEWQIGILGLTAGLAFVFGGGGRYSLDHCFGDRLPGLRWRMALAPDHARPWAPRLIVVAAAAAFGLALMTNQVFHGGVWGPLHNKSVRPQVAISHARLGGGALRFTANRVEGPDVYGSFLIGVRLLDAGGTERVRWSGEELARTPASDIANRYVAKIRPGAHSLVLPLGAEAEVALRAPGLDTLRPGDYSLELIDVSGATWSAPVVLPFSS